MRRLLESSQDWRECLMEANVERSDAETGSGAAGGSGSQPDLRLVPRRMRRLEPLESRIRSRPPLRPRAKAIVTLTLGAIALDTARVFLGAGAPRFQPAHRREQQDHGHHRLHRLDVYSPANALLERTQIPAASSPAVPPSRPTGCGISTDSLSDSTATSSTRALHRDQRGDHGRGGNVLYRGLYWAAHLRLIDGAPARERTERTPVSKELRAPFGAPNILLGESPNRGGGIFLAGFV